MAEFINKDDMVYLHNNGEYDVYSVPEDAERIEIIRCCDCQYNAGHLCLLHGRKVRTFDDDYCSRAKRKDNG